MKRIIFVAALLAMVSSMNGQPQAGKFSLTPKIGVNWSKTTDHQYWVELYSLGSGNSRHHKTNTKAGIVAGVDADYMITKWLGAALGVTYSDEGFKLKNDYNVMTQHLRYLNISTLAEIYAIKGLALKSGIQYGILLGARNDVKYKKETKEALGWDLNDNKRDYRDENWSIPIAISYEYKNIILDLRYNIGIKNIFSYSDDYKTKSLWLTLGYKFTL